MIVFLTSITLLILFVGLHGFFSTQLLTDSFQNLKDYEQTVKIASEASSYAKRTEGHLFLYLTLGNESDLEKFWNRHNSLEEQIRFLENSSQSFAINELVNDLKDSRYKLVISHEAGDEGFEYPEWIQDYAHEHGVDLRLVKTKISGLWSDDKNNKDQYALWDIYPHADFITYPSLIEGFGNAFLEAVYFKKPILINRYETFVRDIEPHGFDLAVMDGFLTKKTVQRVREILESPEKKEKMVALNYEVARRHYSYSVLRKHLNTIMMNFFGEYVPPHMQKVVSFLAKRLASNT